MARGACVNSHQLSMLSRLVIKPGTERNEMERNETKWNETKRNEMEKIVKSVDSGETLEARRPDCRQTSDFSKTQSVDSIQC